MYLFDKNNKQFLLLKKMLILFWTRSKNIVKSTVIKFSYKWIFNQFFVKKKKNILVNSSKQINQINDNSSNTWCFPVLNIMGKENKKILNKNIL